MAWKISSVKLSSSLTNHIPVENEVMAEKYKILMIEDEKDITFSFAMAFQSFPQIDFLSSENAAEGIQVARTERPSLIMLDLRMPGMNGEEALIALKKFLPESKFIVMTGWDDGETRERIESQIGVDAYYPKPVDLEKIVTKIISLVMVKE